MSRKNVHVTKFQKLVFFPSFVKQVRRKRLPQTGENRLRETNQNTENVTFDPSIDSLIDLLGKGRQNWRTLPVLQPQSILYSPN
jgi:hypothetical protein